MKKQILFFAVAALIGHVIYTFNPKETLEKTYSTSKTSQDTNHRLTS